MIRRPNINEAFSGALSEVFAQGNARNTLVVESGVLGGDLLPANAMEPTRKEIEKVFDDIARATGDDVDVRIVGSSKFGTNGSSPRQIFGDIDIIIKCEKLETLSRIKEWVIKDRKTANVRDIRTMKTGADLDVDTLSDQFSFLFPMYKDGGQTVNMAELRFGLQSRFDGTTWKDNHDERLRIQSNLKNAKDRNGVAMVQVDVMRIIVGDKELERLQKQAQKFSNKLDAMDDEMDELGEYKAWLKRFISDGDVKDFESHYEFLRKRGELQTPEDQRDLAALYYLQDKAAAKEATNKKFGNIEYRYGFHPDALQIIYYIANQVGAVLNDDDFDSANINKLIESGVRAGVLREPKLQKPDGTMVPPAEQKRLTVSLLRNPRRLQEALEHFQGKHKEAVVQEILRQTRNKRSDESNKDALYNNYGTRSVKKVST